MKKEVLDEDESNDVLAKSYDKCSLDTDFSPVGNPVKKDELF